MNSCTLVICLTLCVMFTKVITTRLHYVKMNIRCAFIVVVLFISFFFLFFAQLIMDALDALTRSTSFYSIDGHVSLSRKILALHLVYSQCSSEVLQFGQLVSHRPSILRSLFNVPPFVRAGGVSFDNYGYAYAIIV